MKGQISLEFLYVNAIALIVTIFLIGVFISYFSSSISVPDRCVTPYFLNCENMFIDKNGVIILLRNNFDYDLYVTKIILNNTEFRPNILIDRGKSSNFTLNLTLPTGNINLPLEVYYRPAGTNQEYVLYGRVAGRVR